MSYTLPTQSPFTHSVGICFHTNMCNWYVSPTVKYSRENQIKYSQDRLEVIAKTFKLIRVYSLFVPGFQPTGDLDPCTAALVSVIKANSDVEGMISTADDTKTLFQTQANVDAWVAKLKSSFGSSVSQIKTILIGNEINANGFTVAELNTIYANFKANADFMALKIPLSVSFSNLPVQSGNTLSDNLVAAVSSNWDASWNGGNSFVFIDPYPDASGIGTPAGVFDWQSKVQTYYAAKHPKLQIFIAETGAEGDATDQTSVPIISGILSQLNDQYTTAKTSVPTFLFEAVDEQLKPGTPVQTNMGVYKDAAAADGSTISIKSGITVPSWVS
ncbi:MAG: hypothetical protein JKY48_13485 [Flavobacteriales bacterium]|nr:hypothetical protein [Flavobacteriales bacterium]